MKVRELLKKDEVKNTVDWDVYRYSDSSHRLHSDYIESVDLAYSEVKNMEVDEWYVMDEEEYSRTILANTSEYADFEQWYDDKDARVLIIMVSEGKDDGQSFADKLTLFRAENSLTQTQAAKILGVSPNMITRYETGKAEPSRANKMAFAKKMEQYR